MMNPKVEVPVVLVASLSPGTVESAVTISSPDWVFDVTEGIATSSWDSYLFSVLL